MDAITILIDQHRKLEALMKTGLQAQQNKPRSAALAQAGDDLTKHILSEEEVFYPAIKAKGTQDVLLESLEEHLSLKRLLADLMVLDPADATWEAKFKVLSEQTEHHHKEEEEHLFPKVLKALDKAELVELGQQILARQQSLQQAGRPREAVNEQTDRAAQL